MAATGSGEPTGTMTMLRTKVWAYTACGTRSSSQMSLIATVSRCVISQPDTQASMGNRMPLNSGEAESSAA